MEKIFKGNSITSGIEIGETFLFYYDENQIIRETIQKDKVDDENNRFLKSVEKSKKQLKRITLDLKEKLGDEAALIIETQYMLLKDKELVGSVSEKIKEECVRAEWAIKQVEKKYFKVFSDIPDLAFKEKRNDISDILNRIIDNLKSDTVEFSPKDNNIILVADDIPPSIAASMISKRKILGLILEKGCETSHSVILAKTLEIPTIIGTNNLLGSLENGNSIIIDSVEGKIIVNPQENTIKRYEKKKIKYAKFKKEKAKILLLPDKTKDGVDFHLSANIEFPFESERIASHGAKGIGLFRTEFLFNEGATAITEEDQYLIYKSIAQKVLPHSLTIRTFDVGRDKTNDYIEQKFEQNPALGTMAVRLFLKEPKLLRTQIRAVLRANENGNIKLLFPMITEYEEITALKKIIVEEKGKLRADNKLPNKKLDIGIMIEIPGTIKLIRHLKDDIDFFSLGTNDLIQYLLAVDRNNSSISYLYSSFNSSVLASLKEISEEVKKIGKEVTVCGEIAGKGITALLLLGMGFTKFSMNPLSVVDIKKIFTAINTVTLKSNVENLFSLKTKKEIEEHFSRYLSKEYSDILKI